jgi:hypothetical protein
VRIVRDSHPAVPPQDQSAELGGDEVTVPGTVTVNGPEGAPDWDAIDWQVHEGNVGRLRRRIFEATREQDWATVRSLRKMMLRSWSNTLPID